MMFDVYQWEQEMYDGTMAVFEKLKRPDTVVVFPVLPDGRILLIEQEQPGGFGPFISAPGGRIDAGEDPLTAAKRELLEESGYEAEQYELWDARQPVNKIDWVVFTFIAKGLKQVADLHLDAGEKITPKPVSFDEFLEITVTERFSEKEVLLKLVEARLSAAKYEDLRKLFSPAE